MILFLQILNALITNLLLNAMVPVEIDSLNKFLYFISFLSVLSIAFQYSL